MPDDDKQPGVPSTGAGGASGPTGATNESSAGAVAQGPLEQHRPHAPTVTGRAREGMFGIVYDGHPSLTRILMPDDWNGHPQLKSYPLGGIPVEYKGAEIPPPDQRRAYT